MKNLLITLCVSFFLAAGAQNYCSVTTLPASLQSSLVAFYPFCGNANDVTANAYNGTVTNATLTTDRYGNANSAYSFDGESAYIETMTAFMNASWNQYSISFWFCTNDTTKEEQILFNTLPHNSIAIGYNYTGGWLNHTLFSLNSDPSNAGSWDITLGTQGTYTNYFSNQWYHVVLVRNGSLWTEYLNGAITHTFSSSTSITNTITPIIVGGILYSGTNSYGEFFSGKLDDYMIYNRALSDTEIQQLYCTAPLTPVFIDGPADPCPNTSVVYSVSSVSDATSYSWSLPSGWSGTSSSNSIIATVGNSGSITVSAMNSCGTSASISYEVNVDKCATGLAELTGGKKIVMYPNPVSDVLTIEFNEEAGKLRFFSADGSYMGEQPLVQGQNQITVKNLMTGMYFLEITGDTNSKNRTRFIKE